MKRRKAREYALQFLYGVDVIRDLSELEDEQRDGLDLQAFWAESKEDDEEVRRFAEDLARGTIGHVREIDMLVQDVAEHWRLGRMAAVDRNILRFAAYELLFRLDIPEAVTINEAIEIAKKYSSLESASFINGILDRIAKERRGTPQGINALTGETE